MKGKKQTELEGRVAADWKADEAELELDKEIEEWIKKYALRNAVVIDILLRQIVKYHMRDVRNE